jgi:hypothetical protein
MLATIFWTRTANFSGVPRIALNEEIRNACFNVERIETVESIRNGPHSCCSYPMTSCHQWRPHFVTDAEIWIHRRHFKWFAEPKFWCSIPNEELSGIVGLFNTRSSKGTYKLLQGSFVTINDFARLQIETNKSSNNEFIYHLSPRRNTKCHLQCGGCITSGTKILNTSAITILAAGPWLWCDLFRYYKFRTFRSRASGQIPFFEHTCLSSMLFCFVWRRNGDERLWQMRERVRFTAQFHWSNKVNPQRQSIEIYLDVLKHKRSFPSTTFWKLVSFRAKTSSDYWPNNDWAGHDSKRKMKPEVVVNQQHIHESQVRRSATCIVHNRNHSVVAGPKVISRKAEKNLKQTYHNPYERKFFLELRLLQL